MSVSCEGRLGEQKTVEMHAGTCAGKKRMYFGAPEDKNDKVNSRAAPSSLTNASAESRR